MFYIARGLAAWFVAGQQLTGFPESYNLLGRKVERHPAASTAFRCPTGSLRAIAEVVSVQTLWMLLVARRRRRSCSPTRRSARRSTPPAATSAPPPMPASTPTACASSRSCCRRSARPWPGIINVAYFRSFNPVAGQFRELDAIAAVIIGGGSIFGGYGTMIGALAGAAVITLVRALLQLNVQGFIMPQHWVNVFIGLILIVAVLIDIWVRQANIFGGLRTPSRATRAVCHRSRQHA